MACIRDYSLIQVANGPPLELEEEVRYRPVRNALKDALKDVMGEEILAEMAREVARKLRANLTVDWAVRDSVRARLRVLIRTLLRKYKYPPDQQPGAVETVLRQAEVLSHEQTAL